MLDVKITQGAYWQGSQIPYWVYVCLTIFLGIFGLDHLALRSPLTAILKFLSIVPLLGFWYFYDIAQALGERELIEKYGIGVPFFGPVGIGAGIFSGNKDIPESPKKSPKPWLYFAYVLTTVIFTAFPVSKIVIGDYAGAFLHVMMYILFPLTFLAIIWTFYDIYRVILDTRGIFEKGPARFLPASWIIAPYFKRDVLGPLPSIPMPATTWLGRLIESWSEVPIAAGHTVTAAIERPSTATAINSGIQSSKEAVQDIKEGVKDVAESVTEGAEKASEVVAKIAANTAAPITSVVKEGTNAAKNITSGAKDVLTNVTDTAKNVSSTTKNIVESVGDVASEIAHAASSASHVGANAVNSVDRAVKDVGNVANSTAKKINNVTTQVQTTANSAAKGIDSVINSTANSTITGVDEVINSAAAVVETIPKAATDAVKSVIETVANTTKTVVENSKNAAEVAAKSGSEIASNTAKASSSLASLVEKLPEVTDKVSQNFPAEMAEKAKQAGGALILGGAIFDSSPSISTAALIFTVVFLGFSGYVFYTLRNMDKQPTEKSDDPPRESRAIRVPPQSSK